MIEHKTKVWNMYKFSDQLAHYKKSVYTIAKLNSILFSAFSKYFKCVSSHNLSLSIHTYI